MVLMALWFCGFMVCGFVVLWLCYFMASWFRKLQNPYVTFQVDTDPISKILKILLRGSSSLVGARLFQNR